MLVSFMALVNLAVSAASPSHAQSPPTVPVGFAVAHYAAVGGLTTSLAFGPDTRNLSIPRLYVARFSDGQVVAIDDTGGVGGPPSTFATGFRNPLGVLAASDGTVFVSDAEAARPGPFGTREYGRVWRLRDTNADGDAVDAGDVRQIVLKDLPNGRHNTNGMAFGPDGMLYVTNGNSTDDGIDGGEPEVKPWSGSVIKIDPLATDVSLTTLSSSSTLVAHGMRNDFDIAFSPIDATKLFITTNGADDARENQTGGDGQLEDSDDLLYITDIDDRRRSSRPISRFIPQIDDFGFPSCLYNNTRQGNLEPYDSPNPQVIAAFGPCPKMTVPRPVATFGLHVSADGLEFQRTNAWGTEFRNDLFVAEFGNFFGDEVVGHKVVRVELDATGTMVTGQSDFLSGGAPLDVTFDSAGNFYVADFSGEILRVVKVA
jgi:glucose/arabinose dehydrogenase